jgi:hypothetical protein
MKTLKFVVLALGVDGVILALTVTSVAAVFASTHTIGRRAQNWGRLKVR